MDKYSILQIKVEQIEDESKLYKVLKERDILEPLVNPILKSSTMTKNLCLQLYSTNRALWDVEDNLRRMEKAGVFGESFIQEARRVYILNDQRAELKRQINVLLGSEINEVKSYPEY